MILTQPHLQALANDLDAALSPEHFLVYLLGIIENTGDSAPSPEQWQRLSARAIASFSLLVGQRMVGSGSPPYWPSLSPSIARGAGQ